MMKLTGTVLIFLSLLLLGFSPNVSADLIMGELIDPDSAPSWREYLVPEIYSITRRGEDGEVSDSIKLKDSIILAGSNLTGSLEVRFYYRDDLYIECVMEGQNSDGTLIGFHLDQDPLFFGLFNDCYIQVCNSAGDSELYPVSYVPVVEPMVLPHINGYSCDDMSGETVFPNHKFSLTGVSLIGDDGDFEIRFYYNEDNYFECAHDGNNPQGSRVGGVLEDMPFEHPFNHYYLQVVNDKGASNLYPVSYQSFVPQLMPPAISGVSYFRGNLETTGAIKPLKDITVSGSWFGNQTGIIEVCWDHGSYGSEQGRILSWEDNQIKVIFNLLDDTWFYPSSQEYSLRVIRHIDWDESSQYPVELINRDYVEEYTQSALIPDSTKVLGPISYCEPMDLDEPDALIVTRTATRDYFEKLARIHTVTGTKTVVVDTGEIQSAARHYSRDPITQAAIIKDYLADRYRDSGGKTFLVVFGGPASRQEGEDIYLPTMTVYDPDLDEYIEKVEAENTNFLSDFYYADLSEWDSNGNGVHNDDLYDDRIDYYADLGVSRIPFVPHDTIKSANDFWRYNEKVIRQVAGFDQDRVNEVLFLANKVWTFSNIDIDSAWWFEVYTDDRLPESWNASKLYEVNTCSSWGAEDLTLSRQIQEMEAKPNLVVHMGHGGISTLTSGESRQNMSGAIAYGLENSGGYPIFISGACSAGNLENSSTCAGAKLVSAPLGGAVAYIGNSTYGSGPKGGSQFIDGIIEKISSWANLNSLGVIPDLRLAEVFQQGLNNFTDKDGVLIDELAWGNEDGFECTKKTAVLLGDGLIPIHTAYKYDAPEISVDKERYTSSSYDHYVSRFVFTLSDDYWDGEVTIRTDSGNYYQVQTDGSGRAEFILPEDPDRIAVGYHSDNCLDLYREYSFTDHTLVQDSLYPASSDPVAAVFSDRDQFSLPELSR